ncbi:MAG: hypothetical protein CMB56_001530 [Methanobacteriota archaeon]|nr:MAG: hypothetical protein CMB56_001530 [Euryarchaeota archaeon]|tara:strand:+ start:4825 stop:6939 length:2115 start_codon:yes stop_codon:yes gene_type:complete
MSGFSTADMSRIVVAGTLEELSKTLKIASKLGAIHVIDYDGEIEDISLGSPDSVADEKSSLLVKMRGCAAELNPEKGKKPLSYVKNLIEGDFPNSIDELISKINKKEEAEINLERISQELEILAKLSVLNLDLELLQNYESLSYWVGELSDSSNLVSVTNNIGAMSLTGKYNKKDIIAIFCEKKLHEELQNLISESNFENINPPNEVGSVEKLISELTDKKNNIQSEESSLNEDIKLWNEKHGSNLLACIELLESDLEILNAPVKVAVSEHAFVMDGWIPTSSVKNLNELEEVSTIVETERFEKTHHHDHEHVEELPPIAYTERNISKPFELLTDLVGRPKYGTIDPTVFMLVTYPIFFGMMLGDMIYGIFTIILGLWIRSKFNDNDTALLASKIVLYVGVSCLIFGYIYAEFAGWEIFIYEKTKIDGVYVYADENSSPVAFLSALYPFELDHGYGPKAYLPFGITLTFPFHRVGSNLMDLTVIALYLGIIHLALGFIIGMINVSKEHGIIAGFFEKGSWLIVLIGGFFVCYGFLVGNGEGLSDNYYSAMSNLVLYGGITLLIGIICLCYGLAKYEGFGALGIFVGPLESISLLSNVLSYLRLMAIGVVGVKIAEAGNKLGYDNMVIAFDNLFSNGEFLSLFTGIMALVLWISIQLFAWVLGVFSPNIHAARLHFVEWMKQFYDGSGEPFQPFGSKPKLVEVEK